MGTVRNAMGEAPEPKEKHMSFFQEYSLLIAVATPVVALLAMNVGLWFSGERDTLVMPGFMSFPSIDVAVRDVSPASEGVAPTMAANDEERVAA